MLGNRGRIFSLMTLALASSLLLTNCDEEGPTEGSLVMNNCTSCHLSQDRLVATAAVEEPTGGENSGEG